ncbi:MAG TPA: phosphatase PAP2 family protein [Burkholderiales bacterium]
MSLLLAVSQAAIAKDGPIGIDHPVARDNDGLTLRRNQLLIEDGMIIALVAGALRHDPASRLGDTYWRAIDASVLGAVASTGLKYVFTRSRPTESSDPNLWFQGRGHYSFPSGEVTFMSAAVTPFIMQYRDDHPAIWALELLPVYDAYARVKVGGHWQSDVLAGFLLGAGAGYIAATRDSPFMLQAMPRGFMLGYRARF